MRKSRLPGMKNTWQPPRRGGKQAGDVGVQRIVEIVVAGPVFEQVAQDVEPRGPGRAGEVALEDCGERGAIGAEVQIGDEMDLHVRPG
jgi:hypothetical protein